MNNKILSAILISGIAVSGFAGLSNANESSSTGTIVKEFNNFKFERPELTDDQKAQMEEMRTLMEKQKNGEVLTDEEQASLNEFKANMPERKADRGDFKGGERGFMGDNLTDEEKTALESMTTEEKQAFFEAKKTEQEVKRQAQENVIDKLLAGESLTSEEETVRQEIITQRAERKVQDEERQAKMEEVKTIMEKQKNGETLTDEEQSILDKFNPGRMGSGKFHR